MKFFWAIVTYGVMGLILCAGILQAVRGSFWLLTIAFLGYVLLLARLGCMPARPEEHGQEHPH